MDTLNILKKTPLSFVDDNVLKAVFKEYDRPGWRCMAVVVAAEYGRIVGKREERAKKKKHIEKRRIANG